MYKTKSRLIWCSDGVFIGAKNNSSETLNDISKLENFGFKILKTSYSVIWI